MKAIVHKLTRSNEFYVFLVIVALSVVIQARSGQFFTANNLHGNLSKAISAANVC